MEFKIIFNDFFQYENEDDVAFIDGQNKRKCLKNPRDINSLNFIIDLMGKNSSMAQNLPRVITTSTNLMSNQRIYLKFEGNLIQGFIKVGEKHIFYRDYSGRMIEIDAFCVLDFYVHESCQRKGIGKKIYDYMLYREKKEPKNIAIDAPSKLFLQFMKKHFNLFIYTPQSSNFVFFKEYFDEEYQQQIDKNKNIKNYGFDYYRFKRPLRIKKQIIFK